MEGLCLLADRGSKDIKKINNLIEDICRNGNVGIGKPEPLTGNLVGFWSRRIMIRRD